MNKPTFLFPVIGHADYEPAMNLCAVFTERSDAEALIESFRAYDRKRPESPGATGDEAKDEARELRHYRAWERWMKRHPAGSDWSNYVIHSVPLNPRPTP